MGFRFFTFPLNYFNQSKEREFEWWRRQCPAAVEADKRQRWGGERIDHHLKRIGQGGRQEKRGTWGRERKGQRWPKAAGDVGGDGWWTSAIRLVTVC